MLSTAQKIMNRIKRKGRGWVFTPQDFVDLASRSNVDVILYETNNKNLLIQHFKDDATAFNNLKKAHLEGKGVLNNRISEHIFNILNQCGVNTHLVKRINMREQFFLLNSY